MKAIITEKEGVARIIANVVEAVDKHDGFFSNTEFMVIWTGGKIIDLLWGKSTQFKESKDCVSINPEDLVLDEIKDQSNGFGNQLQKIKYCLDHCDSIIVATEPNDEGEMIFRDLYTYLGCSKPFERLWLQSLTEKSIARSFDNLIPSKGFDLRYKLQKCKRYADRIIQYLIINWVGKSILNGLESFGMEHISVLSKMYQSYIDNHKSHEVESRRIKVELATTGTKLISEIEFQDKITAENAYELISNNDQAKVVNVETYTKKEEPPLLFNLSDLQIEALNRFNFSPLETLTIAESLYERRFITYPKVSNNYIPYELWDDLVNNLRILQLTEDFKPVMKNLRWGLLNKQILKNNIDEHHGILITEKVPSALNVCEFKIYELIANRIIEAVSMSCLKIYKITELDIEGFQFRISSIEITQFGWRGVNQLYEENENLFWSFPDLKIGNIVKVIKPIIYNNLKSSTKQLLSIEFIKSSNSMRNAFCDLLNYKFIDIHKKSLIITEKGLKIFDIIKGCRLEYFIRETKYKLDFVHKGDINIYKFLEFIKSYSFQNKNQLKETKLINCGLELFCPKCKARYLKITDNKIECPDSKCAWFQWREVCGIMIEHKEIANLVSKGRTSLIKNFKINDEKKFNAYLGLDETFKTVFYIE